MTDTLDRAADELQEQAMAEARERFSETVIDHWLRPRHPGAMEGADGYASLTGPCGDTMEFYLVIRDDVIEEVRYFTSGCGNTRACGAAVARRAQGRSVTDALLISAGELIRSGECEPHEGRHCAILAVSTLYRAIADYLLQP